MSGIGGKVIFVGMLATGCASTTSVTRMVGGHPVQGRFVGDGAYAAYLRGVVLETQGQTEAALAAYGEAIRHDPDSAELWTRLGALRCAEATKAGSPILAGPWDAFARASEIDPTYEETWTERARCHLKRGELDKATQAARIAVSLDPNRAEPAILLALVLERQGQNDEALRWLDGLVVREPGSAVAHEAMVAFAARNHDERRRQASLDALGALRPSRPAVGPRPPGSLADLDAALGREDFDRAKRLALAGRVSSGSLALRAAALGLAAFARTQAELVLAADPTDSDARVAALVAADLSRDDAAFGRALLPFAPGARPPLSPLAVRLMGELLQRRVGAEARRAWLQAAEPIAKSDDPLVNAVETRH